MRTEFFSGGQVVAISYTSGAPAYNVASRSFGRHQRIQTQAEIARVAGRQVHFRFAMWGLKIRRSRGEFTSELERLAVPVRPFPLQGGISFLGSRAARLKAPCEV